MSLKALSDYTFYSRYAQYLPEEKRRETWEQSVTRVFDMHRKKYRDILLKSPELAKEMEFAETQVKKKRVLGAQRALQYGGDPIIKRNERIYNCSSLLIDKPKSFQQVVWLLLAGCGVGFSVQKHHIAKLPNIVRKDPNAETKTFVIPDTCEGWADSVGVLLASYFEDGGEFPEYQGKKVVFDFSQIRPKGSLIAGQFKAPGPEPLKNGLEKIEALLEKQFNIDQKNLEWLEENLPEEVKNYELKNVFHDSIELSPIVAYDVLMHSSDFVISGGLRRSATICLFSPDDEEMMKAKTGDWFNTNPQRGRSNNSVVLKRSETDYEEFKEIFESIKQAGEPGFFFCDDDYATTTNPCFTKDTKVLTDSGWRTFEELTGTTPTILQDSRVKGYISENGVEEEWEIDLSRNGVLDNTSPKVGMTQENADIYNLTLSCGREVKATGDHLFATEDGMKELLELEEGDRLLIPMNDNDINVNTNSLEYIVGKIAGLIYGDGYLGSTAKIEIWGDEYSELIQKIQSDVHYVIKEITDYEDGRNQTPTFNRVEGDIYGKKAKYTLESRVLQDVLASVGFCDKTNINTLHHKNLDMKSGFISGLFMADGHCEWNTSKNCVSMRLSSISKDILKDIQLILQEFGINSKIYGSRAEGSYLLPSSNKSVYKEYNCKEGYRLVIGGKYFCNRFLENFEVLEKDKQKLSESLKTKNNFYKTNTSSGVRNIEYIGKEDVYCLVEDNNRTLIAQGITARRCVEIGFWPVLPNGESGVNFCNLTEINGKWCTDEEKFLQACRASAVIGTLQAGYNEFPYLGKTTEEIVRHEALLGCSITGWMDNPDILFDEKILEKGAKEIKRVNEKIAKIIGINPAARLTCSKPAGSTSCVLKTASGIHPHHAKRYIRRVQANKQEFPLQHFKANNPIAVEESVWSANNTDEVISFLCEVPPGAITKNQVNATKLLESVKKAQKHWVLAGNVPERALNETVTHNVSNTITVLDDEWDDVCDYIYKNRQYFTGVSLLSASGDLDYAQAPFSTVLTPSELVKEYGDASVFASGLIVDGLHAFDNNLWKACETVLGVGEKVDTVKESPTYPKRETNKALAEYFLEKVEYEKWFKKIDWIRRAKQFANRHFDGDVKRMTYCLKHVSLWKTWCDLKREYNDVDWTDVVEEDQTYVDADTLASQACVGTKGCDI